MNIKEIENKLIEAKVQVDKHGIISTGIIVPYSWKKYIAKLLKHEHATPNKGSLFIWGAEVFFGAVESPIAVSNFHIDGENILNLKD